MGTFTIATYNVNSIRSRLHIVIPWLRLHRPDVFCMQETKVDDTSFPRAEFEGEGYSVHFRGSKRFNGVAVASLHDPSDIHCGLPDEGGEIADEDRLIGGTFNGIAVLNTYVPQGQTRESPQFSYKLAWYRRFRAFLAARYSPAQMLVWCGDLNVAPEAIDVHDPKRLLGHVDFTPEVWEAFADVAAWGLYDVFRKHHPGEAGQYSFFDYRVPRAVERGLGWRVDHILATASLAGLSRICEIDREARSTEKPSDHTIMYATFEI